MWREQITGVGVDTNDGALKLAIPDPLHVLMRNAPSEFVCGPHAPSAVSIEYAVSGRNADADGVLRGMDFEGGGGAVRQRGRDRARSG